jgi:hypothetical protein
VASEFGEDARRPKVEKTTGAVDSCPQSWQLLRRATESEVSHGGAVESASHAAHDREAAVSGELIRFGCRARGKIRRESSEWSPAHRRRGFLPGGTYPMATAHESQRPAINGDGPPATSEKGGGNRNLLQSGVYCTMECSIRVSDRGIYRANNF